MQFACAETGCLEGALHTSKTPFTGSSAKTYGIKANKDSNTATLMSTGCAAGHPCAKETMLDTISECWLRLQYLTS